MVVIAKAPASCGELIQGNIFGKEMLVSCPVNLYSKVEISFKKEKVKTKLPPKVTKAVRLYLKSISEHKIMPYLNIRISSEIPISKGMASSTADMTAAVKGVAHLLGNQISEREIANILTLVEPTDSTVFQNLTLFDHLKGQYVKSLGEVPRFCVLVLEEPKTVDTIDFHKRRSINRPAITKEYKTLVKGVKHNRVDLIGSAAVASAICNQIILNKPYLDQIVNLVFKCGGGGLNIAHSGTVCGVIYDDSFDAEKFICLLNERQNPFINIYKLKTVIGGAKIE
ncbi:hypothetical protein PRVXH_000659 [Proteinivorax hydrogeniformans]|uniref:L-threonine kinase n=1 Tax=Proteinivorax hydrogeniformans TaxID=1826727 RepID=A0AAU8HVA7_9FIRM